MKKSDLNDLLAERHGLTRKQAAEILDTILGGIATSIQDGKPVVISGFGRFEARERPARESRNPRTGAPLKVRARRVPFFRPSKSLSSSLNTP